MLSYSIVLQIHIDALYNTQWKTDWFFNTQSRVLLADSLTLESNEKATFNINMPYSLLNWQDRPTLLQKCTWCERYVTLQSLWWQTFLVTLPRIQLCTLHIELNAGPLCLIMVVYSLLPTSTGYFTNLTGKLQTVQIKSSSSLSLLSHWRNYEIYTTCCQVDC